MPRFTPGCCCAEVDCVIASDTGTGSDSTTLSGTYEAAGNWARTSNRIHPDHAASDQRLLWTTESSAGGYVTATMKGSIGDTLGIAIYGHSSPSDASGAASGGNYVEARITIGTGTSGRFEINKYVAGVLSESWDADTECSANEYDIAAATDVTLTLCISGSHFSATLTIGVDVYEIGYLSNGSLGGSWAYGALTTGTTAATGSFINFEFRRVSASCEECVTCSPLAADWTGDSGTQTANWTQGAGTWVEATDTCVTDTGVETEDTDAFLIHNDHWANDNLLTVVRICAPDLDAPFKCGIVFSYVDTSTNWRLELHIYEEDLGFGSQRFAKLTLWNNDDPVWTVDGLGGDSGLGSYIDLGVRVYDCTIWVLFGTYVWCAYEDAALNDTGKVGVFTGDTVTTNVQFSAFVSQCSDDTWTCTDGWVDDPYDPGDPPGSDPDPGDPTGCCDLVDLTLGDEYEFTPDGITYYTGGACGSCTDVDSAWLTAFNGPHTAKVVWKSASYVAIEGSLGLDNPCDSNPETAVGYEIHYKMFIVPVDETTCEVYGVIYVPHGGTCGQAKFSGTATVTMGDACLEFDLNWTSGNLNGCCLNASGGASIAVVKL